MLAGRQAVLRGQRRLVGGMSAVLVVVTVVAVFAVLQRGEAVR